MNIKNITLFLSLISFSTMASDFNTIIKVHSKRRTVPASILRGEAIIVKSAIIDVLERSHCSDYKINISIDSGRSPLLFPKSMMNIEGYASCPQKSYLTGKSTTSTFWQLTFALLHSPKTLISFRTPSEKKGSDYRYRGDKLSKKTRYVLQ